MQPDFSFLDRYVGRPAQATQPQPKKKKNFFLDQLSTVGGIIGGIGGTLISPIAGTAAGGAAGSALGEAIENAVTGDSIGKNVVKEGLLGGTFAAGPLKLLKSGVGAATGRAAAREGAEAVTRGTAGRIARTNLGDAWGIKTGVKVSGKPLTPQSAGSLQDFITKEVGVPRTANANRVAARLEEYQQTIARNIDDNLSAINTPIRRADKANLLKTIDNRVTKLPGMTTADPELAVIKQQIQSLPNTTDLVDFRRALDGRINYARTSPNPEREEIFRAVRDTLGEFTNKLSPELKRQNQLYTKASRALEAVLPAAKTPRGVQLPGFLGRVGGNTAQSGRAAIGQTLGGVSGGIAGRAAAPVTQSARGIATRQIGQNLLLPRGQSEEVEQLTPEQQLEEALLAGGPTGGFEEQVQEQSPYGRENLMYDIQRDPENADKYIAYYQQLQEIFTPAEATQKPLSSTQQQRVGNAQSGLSSLDVLEDTLATDPGAFARQALPNPLGITARLTGTGDLRAATDNVVDVIARLRSGAAITEGEARRFARLLPQAGDSPDVAARKIARVRADLENVVGMSQAGGGSLEDILMAQGGF